MKNFLKIADGVDVVPILHSVAINDDLWNEGRLRTTHKDSPHTEADDIWVFFNDINDNPAEAIDDLQTYPYRAWDVVLPLRPVVLDLMRRVSGTQLGRVLITRLKPGAQITPHVDEGSPATFYNRYQIALKSAPGALFNIEDETVNFKTGEVWWINNRTEHSVVNNSSEDRIVCIVDIRSC